jgi:putative methionine-R-sulfoxide reductase with GAF domain
MADPVNAEKQATFFLYQSVRNARRSSVLLFVVSLLTAPVILWLAVSHGASLLALAPLALAAILTLVSFRLANSNYPYQAAYILIGANLMMGVVLVSILGGLGLIWTFNSFLISILLALRILPRPKLARTAFVAAAIAIGILILDTGAPWPRPELILMGQWLAMVLGAVLLGLLLFWEAPEFASYSLRAKFVIGNIIVVTVTVAGLTLFINWSTGAALTSTVGNNLNSVAETQARALGELLSRQIGVLQGLGLNQGLQVDLALFNEERGTVDPAELESNLRQTDVAWTAAAFNDPLVQTRLNNAIARELLEFRSRFAAHSEVFVTDRYGGLVAATNRTNRYYFADEEWWQAAYNGGWGGIFINRPDYDAGWDTFSIRIAIPVYGSSSRNAVGVLASTYSLREMQTLLATAEQKMGETGQLNLLLPSGEIVSFQESAIDPVDADLLANLKAIPSQGYDTFEFHGAPSVISRARVNTLLNVPEIDALDWQVVIHEAREASQVPVQEQRRNVILFGLIALVISSVIADLVGRSLTQPIVRLRDTAGEVAAGNLSARARVESHDEIGALATTFNAMTAELQQTLLDQERKIADRTRALEVSLQVSRRLSTILDERQLVAEVVRQVQQAFDYYHVHIYLLDKTGEKLVMAGGTGEAGRVLLAAGHSLTKDQGLIGQAFETNQAILEPDVKQNATWIPNPLLPYTKAEIAVPIALGNQVLGVLDVQHNVQNGLNQEDADLLQAVANQVAIALRNARSYEAARRQAEREAKINAISQRIQSTTSVESAMQVAVRELGRALGAGSTVIKLTEDALTPGNGRSENNLAQDSWQSAPPDQA